jgi:hypothetical protein
MAHAGTENGNLIVTYDDLVKYGLDRRSIAYAVDLAEQLGFLDVIQKGIKGFGPARRPSIYGLTWLDRADRTPASNRWRQITTSSDVQRTLEIAAGNAAKRKGEHLAKRYSKEPGHRQDIESSSRNETGELRHSPVA